jgi:hypothetical protein
MPNEIVGFDGLNYFLKQFLSELTIKCVIGFERFVIILDEMVERDHYFS